VFLDSSSVTFTSKQIDERSALGESEAVSDYSTLIELLMLWRLYKPQVQKVNFWLFWNSSF